jgi:hypothetical protein
MRTKLLTLALFVCLSASAQMKMSVEQLEGFVKSSVKLGHDDKRVAEYLKRVALTNKLEEQKVAELEGLGIGPKTLAALQVLQESSKKLTPPPPPPPPKKVAVTTLKPPPPEETDRVLKEVSSYARDYVKQLPNFICLQRTLRYYDPSGTESWRRDGTIDAQLTFNEQKEDYKIIMVDGRATTGMSFEKVGGATSTGEFGSMLKEIFDPDSLTQFRWERWGTLRGRRMHVYSYRVAKAQSRWSVRYQRSEQITPGYSGLIFADADTNMVMKVTLEADDIPVSFPIQQAGLSLDYDFQKIADREYVLPLRSIMRMRESKTLVKNETEFRLYRKFGAEAIIKAIDFENLPPLPDSTTQEQPPKK